MRPILYSSRPIRLQIFHIFCTFAMMAFKICTFLTFKNVSNKDIGHYAKGYGNQFDTIYFYLHSRFLTLLNLFHDSSCKIFFRLKCYEDILKDVSKRSASIFAFYFFSALNLQIYFFTLRKYLKILLRAYILIIKRISRSLNMVVNN